MVGVWDGSGVEVAIGYSLLAIGKARPDWFTPNEVILVGLVWCALANSQ